MHELFTNPEESIFLTTPFAFRHFLKENASEEDTDFNFILVLGSTVVIAGRETRQVTKYDSLEDIIPVLKEYFPKLIPSEIERSITVWNQYIKGDKNLNR
jgi:hypothetical protein